MSVINFREVFPNPISKPVAAPHGPILVRKKVLVMSGFSGSVSCLDRPKSELCRAWFGRKDGTKYKTTQAKENCTSMCIDVVKRGNAKLSLSESNIHVLHYFKFRSCQQIRPVELRTYTHVKIATSKVKGWDERTKHLPEI